MNPTPPLLDDARLGVVDRTGSEARARAIAALDALPPDRRPYLCDISQWEVGTLVERGRLQLDVPLDEWLEAAALPETFHRVPADRLIVAAAARGGFPC